MVGPDGIHDQFLKHLPKLALRLLFPLFNDFWVRGVIPNSWREVTVISIPQPDKDHSEANNYHPTALTSCIYKAMEHMANNCLVWLLESGHHLSDFQCGFRRHHSTNDHLVHMETFIRDVFLKKEHIVAVFFNLKKSLWYCGRSPCDLHIIWRSS